ncbi:hypothetical protein [Nannocystis pusilla]|uniref:Restriction endonuclease n=1 Tax=Nannocystis pusilla TaxID=889268 RepID=A0ABS7TME0_9BACT|nr:hypothetical protein [Nannocystis pusilla]MBZ5709392.1 hypothetical protein [Nannocystis pusilla]
MTTANISTPSQHFVDLDALPDFNQVEADARRGVKVIDLDTLKHRIRFAALTLLMKDSYILAAGENGSSERSVVFRLGIYLDSLFPDWNVDVEYNRDLASPKARATGDRVFPDVIIHKRGQQGSKGNLAILEAKKRCQINGVPGDIERMRAIMNTSSLRHRFGCYLLLDRTWVDVAFWSNGMSGVPEHPEFATGRLTTLSPPR